MTHRTEVHNAAALWLTFVLLSAVFAPVAQADREHNRQLAQASADDAAWLPTKAQIQEVQQRLVALGFDPGTADGKIGPRTVAAIQKYQRSINVEPNGKLTEDLYQQLVQPEPPAASGSSSATPSSTEPAKPVGAEKGEQSAGCPQAAGRWLFADEQGSNFELTLDLAGRVSGTPYPRHWHWEAKGSSIEIAYDNGMGLTVTRRGRSGTKRHSHR